MSDMPGRGRVASQPASSRAGLGGVPQRRRRHRRRRARRRADAGLGRRHAAAGGDRRAGRIRFRDGPAGGHARAGPRQLHRRRGHEDGNRHGPGPLRHDRPRPGGDVRRRPGLRRGGAALLPGLRRRGPRLPGARGGDRRFHCRGLRPGRLLADRRRDGRAPGADEARRVRPGRLLRRRRRARPVARRDGGPGRRRADRHRLVRAPQQRLLAGAADRGRGGPGPGRGLRRAGRPDPRPGHAARAGDAATQPGRGAADADSHLFEGDPAPAAAPDGRRH